MEWTGYLYSFYSDKPIPEVFDRFAEAVNLLGYKCEQSVQFGEQVLFCFKDEQMLDYHLENGYNTDINGEGCFSIESKIAELNAVASMSEFEGKSDFYPMDIYLHLKSVYYYRLVLPEDIDSPFSKKVFDLFRSSLNL